MSVYQDLLKDITASITAVSKVKEDNRGASNFENLSAVAEGIMVLAWVTVDIMKPWKHVEESLQASQYWGNRVLKEHREKYGIFCASNNAFTDIL